MKVIKRDGRVVDFDKEKISIAIQKANKEVVPKERATKEDIRIITEYIEDLDKKRILVEDIQDIIEEKLMEQEKYALAKKYIVYRYTRALVRKSNTTDESILGIIRNENTDIEEENLNKNTMLASIQRDFIAGEVSRDLTKRMLLPEKISKAHEEGAIYFHNADYFVQSIFNSSILDIGNMLDKGTIMNAKMIESPKSFQVACLVMAQIIAAVESNQYGGQTVDLIHLGKYLRKSHDKFEKEIREQFGKKIDKNTTEDLVNLRLKNELASGIQIIQYQLNTLMTTNGRTPDITLVLHLKDNDEYLNENTKIIEEFLKQSYIGIKNEKGEFVTPELPKLVYVLDENNSLKGGDYDYLTKLAIKCSVKRGYPEFLSSKKMKEYFEDKDCIPMGHAMFLSPFKEKNGKYKWEGRFNQGIVTINLPQIAILSENNEDVFWKLLDERLELCYEALMCRHYSLLSASSNISPIHWQNGAIARLNNGDSVQEYLRNGYSTLSLGYIGINETTKIIIKASHTTKEGHDFAIKLMKKMKKATEKWKDKTGLGFGLYGMQAESVSHRFARIDKERFGRIQSVTDKGYYTNSYYIDKSENIEIKDKIVFESEFQKLSTGGSISFVDVSDMTMDELEDIIRFIYENIGYVGLKSNGVIKENDDGQIKMESLLK